MNNRLHLARYGFWSLTSFWTATGLNCAYLQSRAYFQKPIIIFTPSLQACIKPICYWCCTQITFRNKLPCAVYPKLSIPSPPPRMWCHVQRTLGSLFYPHLQGCDDVTFHNCHMQCTPGSLVHPHYSVRHALYSVATFRWPTVYAKLQWTPTLYSIPTSKSLQWTLGSPFSELPKFCLFFF